jgi:uncharacterized membrane protein (DUF373 family)
MFQARVLKLYSGFEKIIVYVLLALMMVMVLWGTLMLAIEIARRVWGRFTGAPSDQAGVMAFLHQFGTLRDVFGAFLLILIGLELMRTIVAYLERHELHVEVVFTVAMIAIARHAISLDVEHIEPMALVGMGALILALAAGHYFFRRATAGPGGKAGGDSL